MKIVIPLMDTELKNNGVEEYLRRVKECGCNEVAIAFQPSVSWEHTAEKCRELKEYCRMFEQVGVKTAVWIHPTLDLVPFGEYANLTTLTNGVTRGKSCPLDKNYCDDVADMVELIARTTETKKIILEDDFRMQFPSTSYACFCEHHMKFYSEYLGHPVTKEEMGEKICGEPNRYREAYISGLQEGLEQLARAIRAGADRVSEEIVVSFSAGPANCGSDGTDMFRIIDILKGKNPTADIRLSGGPYWQEGFHLIRNTMTAVELERYTARQCKARGIISRAEGDVFPRPRHIVPASHLEFFHTALLFDGVCDEILKYMLDYTATPHYETGYTDAHLRNQAMYETIRDLRAGKEDVGFYPVEDFGLFHYARKWNPAPEMEVFKSPVRNFCVENSLPVSYTPGGVNLIFGDRARKCDLSLLKNGSILDLVAAKALMERGIDVGIAGLEERVFAGGQEFFPQEKENVGIARSFDTAKLTLKEGAEAHAWFVTLEHQVKYHEVNGGELCRPDEEIVSVYTYENDQGMRFMVLNFDASQCTTLCSSQGVFNNYCRQRLIGEKYEWLHGARLEAFCPGHPNLYLMVKKNEEKCVVGLWNFFADDMICPVVKLGEDFSKARFVACEGRLEGDKVILTGGLGAYKFGFIELSKG